jgi:hypothetical protein
MIYLYTNKRVQDYYNIATIIITTQIVKYGPNYSRSPNMYPDSKSMSILSVDGRSLVVVLFLLIGASREQPTSLSSETRLK